MDDPHGCGKFPEAYGTRRDADVELTGTYLQRVLQGLPKVWHTQTMINISLNNEPKQIASDTLLSDALIQWGFGEIKIAVAINSEFVPRSTYTDRQLQDGDQIDIVKPVGGG